MKPDVYLTATVLTQPVALQQLRDSNTALTALEIDNGEEDPPIDDAGAEELVAAAANNKTRHTLRSLILIGLNLTAVPSNIGRLTDLEELGFHSNNIPRIPAEVGSLEALRTLHLSYNILEALPSELCNLTALMVLSLSVNRLTTLPVTFTKLTSLVLLSLSGVVACVFKKTVVMMVLTRWWVQRTCLTMRARRTWRKY